METNKFFCLILPVFFFAGYMAKISAQPLKCDVSAPIAILINADNGKVLFSKNAETPCHPASTTKIATALYVLLKDTCGFEQKIKASHDAVSIVSQSERRNSGLHPSYRLEYGGTHMGIRLGEELDVKSLLYGLMLSSGNDAANVLAEASCGSITGFMGELNGFLQDIGCTKTSYTNPHGMPDPLHYTTALDLSRIARAAMKHPTFKEIVSSTTYERPKTNKQQGYTLRQSNKLLKPGKFFYPYATGLKTGYTIKSGFVLVSSASKDDRNLIAVVMKCDEIAKTYRSVTALFETAFNEPKESRKLFSKEYDLFSHKQEGAKQTVQACLKEDVIVSFYPSEEKDFHSEVTWKNLFLPTKEGEEVGSIRLLDQEGNLALLAPIFARADVEPTFSYIVSEKRKKLMAYIKKKKAYGGYLFAGFLLGVPLRRLAKKGRGKGDKRV
jgi:serine-type D-Ala-D-Ala carboxypeptidase (penicillin-binding protein 5/6)